MNQYLATVYIDGSVLKTRVGNDLDALEIWMLAEAQNGFGNLHGDIIDQRTGHKVKSFRKTPVDC